MPRAKTLFERIDARLAEKVVVDANMSPVSREQYRRLAAVLHDAQGNNGTQVVMVASAVPGEGKTLTATNVALTLSDSYRRRVLLIDADLRRPALHEVFRTEHDDRPDRRARFAERVEARPAAGVAVPVGAASGAADVRSDGRSDVRSHAAAD